MANSSRECARRLATALIVAGLLLVGVCPAVWAAEYYMDPNGDPNGLGTIGDPWDISKLDDPNATEAGDTIYMRGGTYYYATRDDGHRGFPFDLRGDPNDKIVVKPYQDEKPVIDGGLTSTYRPNCQHVQLYGLEIVVSEWYDANNWISTESGSWPMDLDAPNGGIEMGDGTGIDIVNCYIHHFNHNGIGWRDQLGYNSDIHGTIVYLGGWVGPDRDHGHSIYGANTTDSPRLVDQSYFFETMGSNMHVWGSYDSDVSDITWRHNVLACHSNVERQMTTSNFFGGANPESGYLTIDENLFYMSSATFGYDGATSGGGHHYTVTDNTFIRGKMVWWAGTWSNVVTSGNVIWYDDQFSGREYHDMAGLPEWTDPPIVDFHINSYDSNRANLCLIQPTKYDPEVQPYDNTDGNDTISVDFSSWLSTGDVVEVKDARDLYGSAVYTFTYAGSDIDVPVATTGPCGTCKEFSLYVCFRVSNAAPSVDAGTNDSITSPDDDVSLDATVTDDGEPDGETVSQTWSKDSGPGTVTFANANAVDTTATFSTTGTYVLKLTATDTEKTSSDTVTITVNAGATNTAPTVSAGADDSITMPTDTYSLNGTVSDDGLPDPPAALTYTWAKDSGPGTVTFTSSSSVDTTATFSVAGTYVLRLTASDSSLNDYDTVQITVNSASNTAPTVSAGADDSITMPTDTISLDGTVNDDGLPDPPAALTYTWAKDSGPGTVTFTNSSAVDTTATFSTVGTYLLRLTAGDSALNDYDTVQITVNEEATGDPNLELHLKLDDGSGTVVTDDSGNSRDGTTDASWVTGQISGGLEFDGSSTEAIIPDFAIGTDFSVAFWFKSDDNSGNYYQYMFCWGANGSLNCVKVMFGENGNGTYGGKLLTDICDYDDYFNWSSLAVDDPNNYLDGNWHHYAVTVSSANGSKVYVDGVLEATASTRGGETINPDTNIYLGARPTIEAIYRYDGAMDDVRIYSKELDANEVADLAGGSSNAAPTVDAGSNANVEWPTDTTSLDGTVADDGSPAPATLTQTWSKDSGPGTVTFTNANAADTTATFSTDGTYVLKLTASDTEKATSDTVTITVYPANAAPTVDAGANDSITLPTDTCSLDATVADDGLPLAGNLTQTWSKDSGAGTVTFTNANDADTTATFSAAGTYVLRLTASDGTLSDYDTVQIIVNAAAGNTAPTVSAGADDSITMPTDTYSLDGTVSDDGLPDPPAALTYTWGKDSGPGTVTFTNSSAVDTTATFSTIGTYVLRLTASDSALNDYDTVQITVNEQAAGDPNLELHLTMDDGSGTVVEDDSGHDRDGTTDASWATGHISGALEFDGSSTEATVSDFDMNSDFTVAFWFKSDDTSGNYYQYMFSWGMNGGYNAIRVCLGEDNCAQDGQLMVDICDQNDTSDLDALYVDDPNNYLDGDWHHFCLTVSSANHCRMYVDGVLEDTNTSRGGDAINLDTSLYLGAKQTLQSIYSFDGWMDDVRIYSKELDANDVADLASQ